MNIRDELLDLSDNKMAEFSAKLNPTLDKSCFLGIKTPVLRKFAKTVIKSNEHNDFLDDLPHKYFEENQLHGFIISDIKDFDECITRLEAFLPYIDNWAVCDQTSPKIFKKNLDKLLPYIKKWITSSETYTIRFAVDMLMQFYLDDAFKPEYLDLVARVQTDEYYVQMVIAWYFATALAKHYDDAVKFIENKKLSTWIHNKTIQKSVESYRITDEQKLYLKTLKITKG